MRKKPWEGPLLWCKTVLSALKACFQSEHIVNIPRISTGRSLWLQQQISVQVRLSSNARVSLGHNLVYGKYKTSRHSQRIVRLILWYHYLRIKHNCVFFFLRSVLTCCPGMGWKRADRSAGRSSLADNGKRGQERRLVHRFHADSKSFDMAHSRAPRQASSGSWWNPAARCWCTGSGCSHGNWNHSECAMRVEL